MGLSGRGSGQTLPLTQGYHGAPRLRRHRSGYSATKLFTTKPAQRISMMGTNIDHGHDWPLLSTLDYLPGASWIHSRSRMVPETIRAYPAFSHASCPSLRSAPYKSS